jgi:hypothetical protein
MCYISYVLKGLCTAVIAEKVMTGHSFNTAESHSILHICYRRIDDCGVYRAGMDGYQC